MNKLWIICILCAMFFGILSGNISSVQNVFINTGMDTFDFALPIFLTTCFYNGMMEIAKQSGLLTLVEKILHPFLAIIFPDLNSEDDALKYISANVVINMFGLGFAATPSGLKAMEHLQKQNPHKDTATRSMITFLVLNTAGVTIISANIIASRNAAGSLHPVSYLPLALISTFSASCAGLILDRWWNYRKR